MYHVRQRRTRYAPQYQQIGGLKKLVKKVAKVVTAPVKLAAKVVAAPVQLVAKAVSGGGSKDSGLVTVMLPGGGSMQMTAAQAAQRQADIASAQAPPVQLVPAAPVYVAPPKLEPAALPTVVPAVTAVGPAAGSSGAAVEVAVANDRAKKRATWEAKRTDRAERKTEKRARRAAAAAATPSITTADVVQTAAPSMTMPSAFASTPQSYAAEASAPVEKSTASSSPDRTNLLWIALGLGGVLIYLRKSSK